MKIEGLSHMTFVCKNLDRTTALFKQVFQAEEVYSSGDEMFSISKEKFFLIGGLWVVAMEGESVHQTYNHIAFKVSEQDLPTMELEVKKLGLTILPGRPRVPGEAQSLYFYDDDNHLFELHTGTLQERLDYYAKHKPEKKA